MNKKLKIAIIGAGYMAEEYLKVFEGNRMICDGIYSRTLSKSKFLKKKYSIKKIYKTIDDLKKDKDIKGLIIAVNADSLLSILNSLNISNYRILCEKPVGINFKETKKIFQKNKNKHFYVALNRRFYNSNLKANNLVKKEKGKRLIYIRDQELQNSKSKNYNKNLMYWNSVHLIDYINIYARGDLKKIEHIKKFRDNEFSENITILKFSSSDEVLYHCNWNSPGPWSVQIVQKNQSIEMKPLENLVQEKIIKGERKRIIHNTSKIDIKYKPGLSIQFNEFLKVLKNKKNKLVDLKKYFQTVKIIKKIYV